MEDTKLKLNDKTTKVFVNSMGTADVKAFLDYINGVISDDSFVREIDNEIMRVKQMETERVGYMTYEMKLAEERELAEEKGIEKGIEKGKIEIVREMLRTHQPLDFISEMTKFSSEKNAEIGKVYGLL